MKNTKRMFINIPAYNTDEIEKILEDQAKNGWILKDVNKILGYFIFERSNPKNIHYSIVFYSKGSEFDPDNEEGQKELQDFCEHSGWKLIISMSSYHIYANEEVDPIPIETDPLVKLENVHKSYKRRLLAKISTPFAMAIYFLIIEFFNVFALDKIYYLSKNAWILEILFAIICLTSCIILYLSFQLWYKKAKKIANTLGIYYSSNHKFDLGFLPLVFEILVLYFELITTIKNNLKNNLFYLLVVILIIIITLILCSLILMLKQKNIKKRITKIVFSITFIVIMAIFCVGLIKHIFKEYDLERASHYDIVKLEKYELKQYHDSIPLSINDFIEQDFDEYSNAVICESSSILMNYIEVNQTDKISGEWNPDFDYFVFKVNHKMFYNSFKKLALKTIERNSLFTYNGENRYKIIEDDGWNADVVYQYNYHDCEYNRYLICYEDCIIYFDLSSNDELTNEQKNIIRDTLLNYVKDMGN